MKKQAQHVVETPAESQGNAELTGKDCPTICPTLPELRRVKAADLKPGDRFLYGEIVVTAKQQLIQESVSIWYRKDEVRKRERHEDLDDLFPNGIPLLETEKPKEWTFKAQHFPDGDGWSWNGWKPLPWMNDILDPAKKYEVTIKEVPQ